MKLILPCDCSILMPEVCCYLQAACMSVDCYPGLALNIAGPYGVCPINPLVAKVPCTTYIVLKLLTYSTQQFVHHFLSRRQQCFTL